MMLNHLTIIDATGELGALAGHMLAQLGASVTRLVPAGGREGRPGVEPGEALHGAG